VALNLLNAGDVAKWWSNRLPSYFNVNYLQRRCFWISIFCQFWFLHSVSFKVFRLL